jgi:general secretion pathway protein F
LHLLAVGEETGRLDDMLLQIADSYDRDLRRSLQRLVALLEPAIILVMGLIIGVMVVSMLYSIFSINDVPL